MGAAPGAVGGEAVDAAASLREVEGELGEDAAFAALGGGVEVGDAEDHAVVGQRGADRGDRELGAPDESLDAAFAVSLAGGVLRGPDAARRWPWLTRSVSRVRSGLVKTLPSSPTTWSRGSCRPGTALGVVSSPTSCARRTARSRWSGDQLLEQILAEAVTQK